MPASKTKTPPTQDTPLRFADVPGHDLLRPFSQVRGSDQARLVARLKDLGLMSEREEAEGASVMDLDLDEVADFIDYVSQRFALDPAEFDTFTCGAGGMERAINLAMAYAGELGKDES